MAQKQGLTPLHQTAAHGHAKQGRSSFAMGSWQDVLDPIKLLHTATLSKAEVLLRWDRGRMCSIILLMRGGHCCGMPHSRSHVDHHAVVDDSILPAGRLSSKS